MTLANLLGLSLEKVEPDAASISRLMDAARRSLADAQLTNMSSEGRFDMAYKAIMQAANSALQANGYRTLTSKPGHHQTMVSVRRSRIPDLSYQGNMSKQIFCYRSGCHCEYFGRPSPSSHATSCSVQM